MKSAITQGELFAMPTLPHGLNRAGTWLDECVQALREAERANDPIQDRRRNYYLGAIDCVEQMGGRIEVVPSGLFAEIHKVSF